MSLTTRQVMEMGFSKALLPKYEKEGLIERVRQGVYILSDSVHDDMYTLMLRSDHIVFSHDSAMFLLGLSERTPFGNAVRCYDAERSICDLLRSRNRLDEETVLSCIKKYINWKDKNLNRLAEYAVVFHVENKIKTYLEGGFMDSNVVVEKFKEVKIILKEFGTKDEAVAYLVNETKLSEEECLNAYEIIMKIPD